MHSINQMLSLRREFRFVRMLRRDADERMQTFSQSKRVTSGQLPPRYQDVDKGCTGIGIAGWVADAAQLVVVHLSMACAALASTVFLATWLALVLSHPVLHQETSTASQWTRAFSPGENSPAALFVSVGSMFLVIGITRARKKTVFCAPPKHPFGIHI